MSLEIHQSWTQPEILALLIPALAKLSLQLFVANGYGFNGDELYYLACSNHLDWDTSTSHHSRFFCCISARPVGDSLLAIRLLPAIAGAFTCSLPGFLPGAWGNPLGQLLAGVCAFVAPVYLAVTICSQ